MPIPLLQDKTILLGVTGSIAAYKAADLASRLRQAGARVTVLLSQSAERFVTPLTFQSVTGERAYVDGDLWGREGHVVHVGLADGADLMLIAPCTADTLARLAHGRADNLISLTALAASCPLLVAPAMDGGMYDHPATQTNLDLLRERGVGVLGPAEGHLASGLVGVGRMLEPAELLGHIRLALATGGPLQGRRIVVTAGGTQEPVDPVRVLTNRSSGKQGYALAQAALDLGAQVTLVSAPAALSKPVGAELVRVGSAREMRDAVLEAVEDADVLLMAAAVADFTPVRPVEHKIKKGEGAPQVDLEAAPDILQAVAERRDQSGRPRFTVGFAAESRDLLANARAKLESKRLDLIVANDILASDAGFYVDTNRVTLLAPDGQTLDLPHMSKDEVAREVLERVVKGLQ